MHICGELAPAASLWRRADCRPQGRSLSCPAPHCPAEPASLTGRDADELSTIRVAFTRTHVLSCETRSMRHPLRRLRARFRTRLRFRPSGRSRPRPTPDPSTHPIARAVASGRYTDEQATAARRGLGDPNDLVSAEALLGAAEALVLSTDGQTAAEVLSSARNLRAVIESDAVDTPTADASEPADASAPTVPARSTSTSTHTPTPASVSTSTSASTPAGARVTV